MERAAVLSFLAQYDANPEGAGLQLLGVASVAARSVTRQATEADDVAQEAVIRSIRGDCAALRRFDPSTPLAAAMRGICRNVSRERARGRRRERRRCEAIGGVASEPGGARRQREAGGVAAHREPGPPAPRSTTRALPPSQGQLVQLVAFGLRIEEAAAALGISRSAAYQRLRRAAAARVRRDGRRGRDPSTGWSPGEARRQHAAAAHHREWAARALANSDALAFDPQELDLLRRLAAGEFLAEIAAALDVAPATARSRVRRLRARLDVSQPETRGSD